MIDTLKINNIGNIPAIDGAGKGVFLTYIELFFKNQYRVIVQGVILVYIAVFLNFTNLLSMTIKYHVNG
jgi:hypothetical protein